MAGGASGRSGCASGLPVPIEAGRAQGVGPELPDPIVGPNMQSTANMARSRPLAAWSRQWPACHGNAASATEWARPPGAWAGPCALGAPFAALPRPGAAGKAPSSPATGRPLAPGGACQRAGSDAGPGSVRRARLGPGLGHCSRRVAWASVPAGSRKRAGPVCRSVPPRRRACCITKVRGFLLQCVMRRFPVGCCTFR